MSRKPFAAKAPVIVSRKLRGGVTIRIPVRVKKATHRSPASVKIAGPVERRLTASALAGVSQKYQTKDDPDAGVWVKFEWLRLDPNLRNAVDPIDRDVKKVLAALKRDVAAGRKIS